MALDNEVILFANTGIQYVCIPLDASLRFRQDQLGHGWRKCRVGDPEDPHELYYVQWQIVPGGSKLFLAVDTTCGESEDDVGYFLNESALVKDFDQKIEGLLGDDGKPLEGLPPIEFTIRAATAVGGEPVGVDLIVDFGNSRTGALLVEYGGERGEDVLMRPFPLINRYHLDAWDKDGRFGARDDRDPGFWFSSRTHWCTPPFLSAPDVPRRIPGRVEMKRDLFGREYPEQVEPDRTVIEKPKIFQDISMVRMGAEANDMAGVMRTKGEDCAGVSSPKRYLWAKDGGWLAGANWFMADPYGSLDPEKYATTLKGPLLQFLPERFAVGDKEPPEPVFNEAPTKPRHAPNSMMVASIYEILCQAYSYINSEAHRKEAGKPGRMRYIRSLTMTYPTGMIEDEKAALAILAKRAIHIFSATAGAKQQQPPEFKLSVDEASAAHLTYIWSEVLKLGDRPDLWFRTISRNNGAATPDPQQQADDEPEAAPRPAQRRRGGRAGRGRPGGGAGGKKTADVGPSPKVRIACIDIGGGTSDLMIGEYECIPATGLTRVNGRILFQDGVSKAGDHLMKRLLEQVIVPQFVRALMMDEEPEPVQRLFGPETNNNRSFRSSRIDWVNRLFVPLANAYLVNAVNDLQEEEICHTNLDIVSDDVLESLQRTIDDIYGQGEYNVRNPLQLYYHPDDLEDVVAEVFDDLIYDFCESIVEYEADVVLLAGQPTKLRYIQELIRKYLPLHNSRIVPMYNRYVGAWYPYQDAKGGKPGVIVDPKSAVVVGAAIEFAARHSMFSQFRFRMDEKAGKDSFYWGVMSQHYAGISQENIFFRSLNEPDEEGEDEPTEETADDARRSSRERRGPSRASHEEYDLPIGGQWVVIGRKRKPDDESQANPVYVIRAHTGGELVEIDAHLRVRRIPATETSEERLEPIDASGTIGDKPAKLGDNVTFDWRTLVGQSYYLDVGGFDEISDEVAADYAEY